MTIELKVPSAGESITEVTVVEWVKGEGAFAKKDEAIALIETDKANVEVIAPEDGVVSRVLKPAGQTAKVGEVIAMFEPGAAAPAGKEEAKPGTTPPPPPVTHVKAPAQPTGNVVVTKPAEAPPPATKPVQEDSDRRTPSQRRAAREGNGHAPQPAAAKKEARPAAPPRELRDGEKRVPMTPMRKRVAERLLEAQQNAALLTTFNEVDMTTVMSTRKTYGDAFKEKHGVKLGFMSFFVRAVTDALLAFPAINAEIDSDDIIYKDYCDIGVAVGGGKGLVVPILRRAEKMSFAEIEKQIADYGERAKTGRLKVDELQGGSFTISNGGIYGSLLSTPIVNPPQSGILGMHAIQERPVVRQGQIAIAPMMYVALTYDHRIVDGREAVSFLVRVKEGIENPARLLLEV
jgi:2-oxoglutarate dehydrogenase E2 component (dihydrolipoamide succinyltransferase)